MSHRSDCPDRNDARREGERAHERGFGSFRNPYREHDNECPEAADAWRSGWYSAERRQEEREDEERQEAQREQDAREQYEMEAARDEYLAGCSEASAPDAPAQK